MTVDLVAVGVGERASSLLISFRGMMSLFMSAFKVLEELWERVLTSLSAHSLVSAA